MLNHFLFTISKNNKREGKEMTDAERLQLLFIKNGVTNKAKFARDYNVPGGPVMIDHHLNGRRPISIEAAASYVHGLKCTLEELSPELAEKVRNVSIGNTEPAPDIKGKVPLISWVQAGKWTGIGNIENLADAETYPCVVSHGPDTYALRVKGKSMFNPLGSRSYDDGDIIFVDPDKDAINGSRVVVRLDDAEEATFKQLVIDGGKKYLMALNPDWPEKYIPINGNATICGVVIGKWVDE